MPEIIPASFDPNSDTCEAFSPCRANDDEAILQIVTCADFACGIPELWELYPHKSPFGCQEVDWPVTCQMDSAQALPVYTGHPVTYAMAVVEAMNAVDPRLICRPIVPEQAFREARLSIPNDRIRTRIRTAVAAAVRRPLGGVGIAVRSFAA